LELDGARSIVAKTLGVENKGRYLVALQSEVFVGKRDLSKKKSRVAIELGRATGGYGWVFPKSDHLTIGFACTSHEARDLRRYYREFLNSLNLSHYTISRWDGAIIPICTGRSVVSHGRVALLGDAAGLADPLTGEGIYNAVLSAQLLAPVIEKSLASRAVGLDDYSKAVRENILPEMKIAYVFSRALVLFPQRVFRLLMQDEKIWRGCCSLLRGETTYRTIKSKIDALHSLYHLAFGR
jgi:flavin-dependent dehydrogenase